MRDRWYSGPVSPLAQVSGQFRCTSRQGAGRPAPVGYAIIRPCPPPSPSCRRLATTLGDLRKRVAAIADRAAAEEDDDTASELFAVERALTGAERRLGRISSGNSRRR